MRCPGGAHRFDVVVVAAGAGTSALAAQVGIDTPATLEHHVRLRARSRVPPASRPGSTARTSGCTRTSTAAAPAGGRSGVLDPELTHWERGREAVAEASRRAVLEHVRERLTVRPVITDSLYCTHAPGLGDGIEFCNGPVLVVYGENS